MPIGRQLLYDAAGRRRPDADVLNEVGDAGLRIALLADAVHQRARDIEPSSSPPHAVVSFADDQLGRAEKVAETLGGLGWMVRLEPRRKTVMTVEEFTEGVAQSRLFAAVLTPSYWEQAAPLYDEIQVATSLPYVHLLAVTRETDKRQVAFHRVLGGNELDPYRYTGDALPPEAEALIRREALAAATARPTTADHAQIVAALADKVPWLGNLWQQLIEIRQRLGDEPGVLAAARRGAAAAPIWEGRERLRDTELRHLYDGAQFEEAFRSAVLAVREFPRNWLARLVIGSLLDDLRRPWTARNHLLLAARAPGRSPQVTNMLGIVYLHLGASARAERCFRDTLAEDPSHTLARGNLALATHLPRGADFGAAEVPGPAPGCTACDSVFSEAPACAGCAAPRTAGEPCPLCGELAVSVLGDECPVCRVGRLTMRDHIPL